MSESAIGTDILPGDIAGIVGEQEADCLRNFLYLAVSFHGDF